TSGSYTFGNRTDDGSYLKIDGATVIYDNSSHGVQEFTGTISLSAGLHSAEFLQFNGGGPGDGQLYWTPPGGSKALLPTASFALHQNKAYVLKFAGDFASLKNAYFTPLQFTGAGGRFYGLN